jgi:biopolymer transport protein ExbB/TolQ
LAPPDLPALTDLQSAAIDARNNPSDHNLSRLVRVASNRTHTLRAITAILPLVGFLGTVAGLSNSLIGASGVSSESAALRQSALQAMEIALGTAFDKSMLAFTAAIGCVLAERWMSWRVNRLPEMIRAEVAPVPLIPVR